MGPSTSKVGQVCPLPTSLQRRLGVVPAPFPPWLQAGAGAGRVMLATGQVTG